jgi:inner membrane protein involved in colicin E2 resistance
MKGHRRINLIKKMFAIAFIYGCTALAWLILASTVLLRSNSSDARMKTAVNRLWGTAQKQEAPTVYYPLLEKVETVKMEGDKKTTILSKKTSCIEVPLQSSRVHADLHLQYRRKGLLWYSTYKVSFHSLYSVANESGIARDFIFSFRFPAADAVYDDFRFRVGGAAMNNLNLSTGTVCHRIHLEPGQAETFEVAYQSQGMDEWGYDFGKSVNQVRDFALTLKTDFPDIDFPADSISPTRIQTGEKGCELEWKYRNLLTGVKIGMKLPHKLNPGPWVSEVTYSAPVSLFLFFFLLFLFTTLKEIKVHPMNYFFIGAGFFSFHLLLAYLIDHVSIHAAFLLSSAVSITLVVSYMRLVVAPRFAYLEIALAQLVYLVLFSYTFFFQGFTGLAITVLSVLTLFVVMQYTGKVDWGSLFASSPDPSARGLRRLDVL